MLLTTSAKVKVNALPHPSIAVAVAKTGVAGQLIVVGVGKAAMTGGVISRTLIVCDAVEEFPQPSVAVHVRFTLYVPVHAPFVVTSAKVKLNELPHPSVAVAVANTGVAGQLIVVGAGNEEKTGGVISCTLMVCDFVEIFPHASVAVHVLVILYDPAHAPFVVTSAKFKVKALPQPSVAVGVVNTGVAGQLIVVGAGRAEMTGPVTSWTLIVCEAVEELPHPSVAVHVRLTEYEPAHAPGVVTSTFVKVNALPQASVTDGTAKTGVAGQLIVEGADNVAKTGAVMS